MRFHLQFRKKGKIELGSMSLNLTIEINVLLTTDKLIEAPEHHNSANAHEERHPLSQSVPRLSCANSRHGIKNSLVRIMAGKLHYFLTAAPPSTEGPERGDIPPDRSLT